MDISAYKKWTHFTIAESLPGGGYGTGGIGLGDFTGSGSLDVAVSRRSPQTAYWFERKDDATWVRHVIGQSVHLQRTLGAAVLDVDQDGRLDVVFSNVWFRNPGNLATAPDTPWEVHVYDGGGHDIVAADINGDGKDDVVTFDGKVLAWFDTSNGIAKTTIADDLDCHGGIAPRGVGDLTGNGCLDIVVPGFWYENPGNGTGEWRRHRWPHEPIPKASYGPSIRSWVADINGTGHNDIVYADCDTGFCHVYWVENKGGGKEWVRHPLPDPPGNEHTGSFHSLAVADFDQDGGNPDIFAGEQEDASPMSGLGVLPMKPEGLKERGVIWVNSGGRNPTFEPVVVHEGRPGWHDVVVGDVSGDGSTGMVSKVWNTDWNNGDRNYHLDYWRNDINRP